MYLEDKWTFDPDPGVYKIRMLKADGSKTEPVDCIVVPTGSNPKYVKWAYTPNLFPNHESWYNYFVHPEDQAVEFAPLVEGVRHHETNELVKCQFGLVAIPVKE